MLSLSVAEKAELKPIAAYIKRLPRLIQQWELYLQSHWEGYPAAQWKERKRESIRYASEEIEESAWEQLLERWQQEDSKLSLGNPPPE